MTLKDRFGRPVQKLRISVTDRCNFRCSYCMPDEGMQWLPKKDLLTFEEITQLAQLFVSLGVTHIRLTGGEPLLRQDLPLLVRQLKAIPNLKKLAITSNGFLLEQQAQALYEAGLRSFNISLDSLDPARFNQMTRGDFFDKVHRGLRCLEAWPDVEVKINTVVMRGVNEQEAVAFAKLARDTSWKVRFIEFMPLGKGDQWYRQQVVPSAELIQKIQEVYPLEKVESAGANPAERWRFQDGAGELGFISSVSQPFCEACNRIRITADGQLRTCLFSLEENDLKSALRRGEDLTPLIKKAIWNKEAGHLINEKGFQQPDRGMSRIGG